MADLDKTLTLECKDAPCASAGTPLATDLLVEVRESGASAEAPVDLARLEVTLTPAGKAKARQPDIKSTAPSSGHVHALFQEVLEGWYRVVAAKTSASGKLEQSAARNVQVVKLKKSTKPEDHRQLLILTLTKQGVATFAVLDDLESKPMSGVTLRIRHPDGLAHEHATDGAGEVALAGEAGEAFSLLEVIHQTHSAVVKTTTQEMV